MAAYVVRRLMQFVPVTLLASIAVWAIIYAVPGSPAEALAGDNATPETVAAMKAHLGLDRSPIEQYFIWIGHVLRLDFGKSDISGDTVSHLLASRVPATVQLAVLAMLIGLILALPLGVIAAVRPRSMFAKTVAFYQAASLAIPTFWIGILLIIAVTVKVKLLPGVSVYVPVWKDPAGAFRNTILPALCLGIYVSGILARFVTASVRDSLAQEYIRTTRAKGVPEHAVITRHALRNALLPTVTVVGLQIGEFLGGSIVTEVVFSYPGLGRMIYTAINSRDYPLIQAAVLFVVVVFLFINLVVDVLYAYLDPRVRLS